MAGNIPIRNIFIVNDNGVYDRMVLENISTILHVSVHDLQNANIRVTKHAQIPEGQHQQQEFQDIHDQRTAREQRKLAEEAQKQREAEHLEKLKSSFGFLDDSAQESWKQVFSPSRRSSDGSFVKTKAYAKVRTAIIHYNSVVILGYPSTGKSATAQFLAQEFNGKPTIRSVEKYKILHLESPEDFKQQVDPTNFMIIIIDDIFGKHSINLQKVDLWQDFLHEMQIIVQTSNGKLKLIITCGSHIYKSVCQFLKKPNLLSKSQIVDITDDARNLDQSEKTDILRSTAGYLFNKETTGSFGYNHIGYPLCCKLYGIFKTFQNLGRLFFVDPAKYLLQELDKIQRFDKTIYGLLVYTALNNGRLDLRGKEITELNPKEYEKITKILQELDVKVDLLEMWILQRAADMLSGVFLTYVDKNVYEMMHHRLTEYILKHFEIFHCKLIVELAVPEVFQELIKTINYDSSDEKNVQVSRTSHDLLARRLIFQILQGNIREACQHQVFTDPDFITFFFEYVDRMGNIEALYRARDAKHNSLLFWAAWYGRDLIVEGFGKNESLARMVDDGLGIAEQRKLALVAACYRGGITEFETRKIYRPKTDPPEPPKPALGVRALLQGNPEVNCSPQIINAESVLNFECMWMMKNKAMPLHYAVVGGSVDAVMAVLEHKPDVNAKTTIGETALHFAVTCADPTIAQLLIEHGAEIEVRTERGKTPLSEAVVYKHINVAKLLLQNGANIDGVADDDRHMLHIAVGNSDHDMLKLLVEQGIDVNLKGRKGWTALHEALYLGDTRSSEFLISKGASVSVPVCEGIVPLHEAISTSDSEITQILLESGMSVNVTNSEGETALHLAAKIGNLEVVKWLLDLRANATARNHSGKMALNYAANAGHKEVMEYLLPRSGIVDAHSTHFFRM